MTRPLNILSTTIKLTHTCTHAHMHTCTHVRIHAHMICPRNCDIKCTTTRTAATTTKERSSIFLVPKFKTKNIHTYRNKHVRQSILPIHQIESVDVEIQYGSIDNLHLGNSNIRCIGRHLHRTSVSTTRHSS